MIGKIDKDGDLNIKRKNKFKPQECPLDKEKYCGDKCSLFGEPEEDIKLNKITVSLCYRELFFDEFTDERVEGKE